MMKRFLIIISLFFISLTAYSQVAVNDSIPGSKKITISTYIVGDSVRIDDKYVGKTPLDIFIMPGKHNVEVWRDKAFDIREIEITEESKPLVLFRPKRETLAQYLSKGVNFVTLNAAYSLAPQMSFGLTYGSVRKYGWFVSLMSDLDFYGFTSKGFTEGGIITLTGNDRTTRFSLTGGAIINLDKCVCLRAGAGFGMRVREIETIENEWYRYDKNSTVGVDVTLGCLFNLKHLTISVDMVTTNFKTIEGKLGLGFNWRKK